MKMPLSSTLTTTAICAFVVSLAAAGGTLDRQAQTALEAAGPAVFARAPSGEQPWSRTPEAAPRPPAKDPARRVIVASASAALAKPLVSPDGKR